jgi:hypothetical protein
MNTAPSQDEIFKKLENNKMMRHQDDTIRKGFLDPEMYGDMKDLSISGKRLTRHNSLKLNRNRNSKTY